MDDSAHRVIIIDLNTSCSPQTNHYVKHQVIFSDRKYLPHSKPDYNSFSKFRVMGMTRLTMCRDREPLAFKELISTPKSLQATKHCTLYYPSLEQNLT